MTKTTHFEGSGSHAQFTNVRRGQVFSAFGYKIVPAPPKGVFDALPDSVKILEKKKITW